MATALVCAIGFGTATQASPVDCLEVDPVIRVDGNDLVLGLRLILLSGASGGAVQSSASVALTTTFNVDDLGSDPPEEINRSLNEDVEIELELRQDIFPDARWGGLTTTQTLLLDIYDVDESSIEIFIGPGRRSGFSGVGPTVTYSDGDFTFGLRTGVTFSGNCTEDPVTGRIDCGFDEATVTLTSAPVPLPPSALALGGALLPFGVWAARRKRRKAS